MNSNLSVVNHSLTMSSREIAELTGKRHDHVMTDIRRMMLELCLNAPEFSGTYQTEQGNTYECFNLPKRESLILISGYNVELRAKIIDRWQELESQVAKPAELSRMEILKLALESEQARIQAEAQRDHAIATKAHIGERREATAMNTASQAVKLAKKLAVELDRSMQCATVKRMEMLYHGQQFNWRLLKSTATEMGIPAIDVFDANYGTVKSYHADVWREAYAIEIIESVEA